MAELPIVSAREARRAFEHYGWVFRRQHGSHMILTKEGSLVSLSIPDHRELAPGTLRKLIRLAGLSVEEFVAAL
ncbi:MAG TPA: type II toxin-antitoxin system HicA family toxin [Polyangia bacterium]|jgi:predicted RNA binding protein YcfA (HicA-like mRNA interferase family)|nr:type II toxin-antitoxin system HicA family toxin [Polyangia bacterium]